MPRDRRTSPIQVLRTIANLVVDVARQSACKLNLATQLSECSMADESSRQRSKNSDNYPRKKRNKPTGEPIVSPLTDELRQKALSYMI